MTLHDTPPLLTLIRVSIEISDDITIIFNFIRDSSEISDESPTLHLHSIILLHPHTDIHEKYALRESKIH